MGAAFVGSRRGYCGFRQLWGAWMMLLPSRDEIFYPLPESGFAMLDLAISSGELRSCEQIPPKTFGAAAFLAILTTQRKGKYLDEIEKRRANPMAGSP